ncbi:MAG: endonuclease/exonuclease/phosphatase family protein [Candidatus Brocadiales bacterium]
MKIRIGSFNAENLFARFRFKGARQKYKKPGGKTGYRYRPYNEKELDNIAKEGWAVDKTKFAGLKGDDRKITARAIKAIKADILALQEIEGMDTLKRFVTQYLSGQGYKYKMVIDANDPRFIDVALLSKFPIAYIQTYQFERSPHKNSFIFSRDCLEVGIQLSQHTVLPVFVNHFKSMMGGRKKTIPRRKEQATKVTKILKERFGNNPGNSPWVVLGDLNDYMPSPGLQPLLGQKWLENILDRLDKQDRWTHYFKREDEYRQLDYILLPKTLVPADPSIVPEVERRGMPLCAKRFKGKRFKGVGNNHPKASDHCPIVMELAV